MANFSFNFAGHGAINATSIVVAALDVTGTLDIADGAAGAPSLRLKNSPLTGFYRGGANDLRAVVNGADTLRMQTSQFYVTNVLQTNGNFLSVGGGYIQLTEAGAAPASPGANQTRIYAVDDGGGKTDLNALFATGAAQPLAGEP